MRLVASSLVTCGLAYLELDADGLAQFAGAVQRFDAVIARSGGPDAVLAPHEDADYGIALEVAGREDDAVTRLRRAITGGADTPVARRHLGRALLGDHADPARRAEAESALREAAAHLPEDPITLATLGALLADSSEADPGRRAEAVDVLVRAGNALGQRARFAEAEAQFARALTLDPDDAGANLGRAESLRLLNRIAESVPVARHANALAPNDYRTHLVLSSVLVATHQSTDALTVAEEGLELAPWSREMQANTVLALDGIGRYDEAIARLRAWLEADPEWAPGLALLGEQLRRTGAYEEAASVLAHAIQIDPMSAYIVGTYGQVLLALGEAERAEIHLRQALEMEPNFAWAVTDHARALVSLQRPQEAVESLERAFGRTPTEPWVAEVYARALMGSGRLDEAIATLLPHTQVDEPPPLLLTWLGEIYRVRGTDEDLRLGEEVLRRAVTLADDSAFAHGTLGALLGARHDVEGALAHLDRAVTLDKHYGFAWKWRGFVLYDRAEYADAEEALQHAVELSKDDVAAWYWLGHSRAQCSRSEEALKAFEEAHRLDPTSASALIEKGRALRALAREEEAVDVFDAALALDEGSATALAEKGDALRMLGRFEQALKALERSLELTDELWVRASRAAALVGLQRYSEALPEFDEIVAAAGDHAFALLKCGEAHSDVGDYEVAWDALQRADAVDPGADAYLQTVLGWVALRRREYETSHAYFMKAAALERSVAPRAFAGDALAAQGRTDEADAVYREGIALGQDQEGELTAWDMATIGWCFMGVRVYDEAARLLRSATDADDDPSLRCDLALALLGSGRAVLALNEYERAFAEAAKGHPWRRHALLAVAQAELHNLVDTATGVVDPSDGRRVKRRMKEEVKAAEPGRYVASRAVA